jgi:hypothetical protein
MKLKILEDCFRVNKRLHTSRNNKQLRDQKFRKFLGGFVGQFWTMVLFGIFWRENFRTEFRAIIAH